MPNTPVLYHVAVDQELDYWASTAGIDVAELKAATENAVRRCHFAAVFAWRAEGYRPNVYELGIGDLKFFYTVEAGSVMIRGYAPNVPVEQLPENEEGRFYCDASWTRSVV